MTMDWSGTAIKRQPSSPSTNPQSAIRNPMRFSRMQLVGALFVLLLIWAVVFYRLASFAS
ncbi:MAG TPA: hypothetical protein VF064_06455 [Pyrinomonadaceae bacterium]